MAIVFVVIIIVAMFSAPFVALASAAAWLVGRRFESRHQAAFFSGLAAVVTLYVSVLTVFFALAVLPNLDQGDWAWRLEGLLNLSAALIFMAIPVSLLAAFIGWRAFRPPTSPS